MHVENVVVCIVGKIACTRCIDGVKVLWCCSHLVWLLFEGSILTCTCFRCDLFLLLFFQEW